MRFYDWLNEGGNSFFIDRETGTPAGFAEKVDLSIFDRQTFVKDFLDMFKKLDDLYKKDTGNNIWKNFSVVKSGKVFNGSSKAFFDLSISDSKFKSKKPKVGDIDIMIPSEIGMNLFDFLLKYEGKNITPNIKYMGNNKSSNKGLLQINAVFEYKQGTSKINTQVDFEFSEFKKDKPTEFASFSHSSEWQDLEVGMKGYGHKIALINAFRAKSEKSGIFVVTPKVAEKINTFKKSDNFQFKVSTSKEFNRPTFQAFSVDRGVRTKFAPVYWADGEGVLFNGKPVFYKLSTKDSKYSRDLTEIFSMLFGKIPSGSDMTDFRSFVGLMKLFKKYFDKKVVTATFENMVEYHFFGKGSQKLSRDDSNEDKDVKYTIINRFIKDFPHLKSQLKAANKMAEEYYKNYKEMKTEV